MTAVCPQANVGFYPMTNGTISAPSNPIPYAFPYPINSANTGVNIYTPSASDVSDFANIFAQSSGNFVISLSGTSQQDGPNTGYSGIFAYYRTISNSAESHTGYYMTVYGNSGDPHVSYFFLSPVSTAPNQYNLFTFDLNTGLYIQINQLQRFGNSSGVGGPTRWLLASGSDCSSGSCVTISYFFLKGAAVDFTSGNVDWTQPFNLGCYTNESTIIDYTVSIYNNDSYYEVCVQGNGGSTSSRYINFSAAVPAVSNTYQTPFNMYAYTDNVMSVMCNAACSQISGGASMGNNMTPAYNQTCMTYLTTLTGISTGGFSSPPSGPGYQTQYTPPDGSGNTLTVYNRLSVDAFLTRSDQGVNQCTYIESDNLYSMMSQQCILYCGGIGTNIPNCVQMRSQFCATFMPLSNSMDDNYTDFCACYWPPQYYTTMANVTIDSLSTLYPGLQSIFAQLFNDPENPQCINQDCSSSNYILPALNMSGCRPIYTCIQSLNLNLGSATNSDVTAANSCIINSVNSGSTSTNLTPAQQTALNAYNNGTLNSTPTKKNIFQTIIGTFDTTGWAIFGVICAIILIVIIVILIFVFKKVEPPVNAVNVYRAPPKYAPTVNRSTTGPTTARPAAASRPIVNPSTVRYPPAPSR